MNEVDMVNNPPHYQGIVIKGIGFEAIDVIEALVEHANQSPAVSANLFNELKYITRLGRKDNTRQDLGKHAWYAQEACVAYDKYNGKEPAS